MPQHAREGLCSLEVAIFVNLTRGYADLSQLASSIQEPDGMTTQPSLMLHRRQNGGVNSSHLLKGVFSFDKHVFSSLR
jgi:hypothetical protein